MILILYIDDLKLTGSCRELITKIKKLLNREFKMTNLGEIKKFGCGIYSNLGWPSTSSNSYTLKILMEFGMEEAHPTFIPMNEGDSVCKDTKTPLCDPNLYCALVGQLHWLTKT